MAEKGKGIGGIVLLIIAGLVLWSFTKGKPAEAAKVDTLEKAKKAVEKLDAERARLKAEGYTLSYIDPVSGAEQWYNADKGELYLLVSWQEIQGPSLSAYPVEVIEQALLNYVPLPGDPPTSIATKDLIPGVDFRTEIYGTTVESWATRRAQEIKYGVEWGVIQPIPAGYVQPELPPLVGVGVGAGALVPVTPTVRALSPAAKAVLAKQKAAQAQYTPYLSESGQAAAASVQVNLQAQAAAGETPTVVPVVIPAGTAEGGWTVYIPGF